METLGQAVHRTCHLTGAFTLRSGQTSSEYFDKYLSETDPQLLRRVAEAMVALLPPCAVLAGMEMGGIPIVTVMSQLTGLPAAFVRKQAKQYGTQKVAEGAPVAGLRVVGVEDVVTTGGALVNGCLALREAGAVLDTVVCAIDREQGGADNLAAHDIVLLSALRRGDFAQVRLCDVRRRLHHGRSGELRQHLPSSSTARSFRFRLRPVADGRSGRSEGQRQL